MRVAYPEKEEIYVHMRLIYAVCGKLDIDADALCETLETIAKEMAEKNGKGIPVYIYDEEGESLEEHHVTNFSNSLSKNKVVH